MNHSPYRWIYQKTLPNMWLGMMGNAGRRKTNGESADWLNSIRFVRAPCVCEFHDDDGANLNIPRTLFRIHTYTSSSSINATHWLMDDYTTTTATTWEHQPQLITTTHYSYIYIYKFSVWCLQRYLLKRNRSTLCFGECWSECCSRTVCCLPLVHIWSTARGALFSSRMIGVFAWMNG